MALASSPRDGATAGTFQYQPLAPSEIRILMLEPDDWDGDIICSLQHVSLDANPSYEALSYVWGDPTKRLPVRLGGRHHEVTVNLESALRHLRPARDSHQPRQLWVDALCIDQENTREREQQVGVMFRIFSDAANVLAWIGLASEDSSDGIAYIRALGSWMAQHEDLLEIIRSGQDSTFESTLASLKGLMSKARIRNAEGARAAMITIFKRPYWTRAWVLQELAAREQFGRGSPCLICCGNQTLEKALFDGACCALWLIHHAVDGSQGGPLPAPIFGMRVGFGEGGELFSWPAGWMMGTLLEDYHREGGAPRLGWPVDCAFSLQATDPRGLIYALLNLAHNTYREAIRVDYNKPFRTLIKEYVRELVRIDNNLELIRCSRDELLDGPDAPPSWTPQLRGHNRSSNPMRMRRFRASGSLAAEVEFCGEDDDVMRAGAAS